MTNHATRREVITVAVNVTVLIDFADSAIKAIDHLQDIRSAVQSASLNLNMRYNVVLQWPMRTEDDRVALEIRMPEDLVENFSYGRRLQGIAGYLLKNYPDRYKQHVVGNRLLTYTVLDGSESNLIRQPAGPSMVERLETIAEFARLLERSDEDSLFHINRIQLILKEAKQEYDEKEGV